MAKTDPINVANPAGGSDPKQGDDYIRTLAMAVAEILGVDHYIGASSPYNEDAAGEHKQITLNAPLTTPPTTSATQQAIFTSGMDSGAAELFVRPLDDGTPIQLTSGGTVLFGSLGSIANDTYLKAANAAGDGTIDLIKSSGDDVVTIPAGAVLSTSGDPTVAAGLVCKEWVEGQVAAATPAAGSLVKAWVTHNSSGVKQGTGYNIASVTRNGTGDYTVAFDTDFADVNYAVNINSHTATGEGTFVSIKTKAVGSVRYTVTNRAGSNLDFACDLTAFGTQ